MGVRTVTLKNASGPEGKCNTTVQPRRRTGSGECCSLFKLPKISRFLSRILTKMYPRLIQTMIIWQTSAFKKSENSVTELVWFACHPDFYCGWSQCCGACACYVLLRARQKQPQQPGRPRGMASSSTAQNLCTFRVDAALM